MRYNKINFTNKEIDEMIDFCEEIVESQQHDGCEMEFRDIAIMLEQFENLRTEMNKLKKEHPEIFTKEKK